MMKPPERVEIPEENELRHERLARILAVLIVIATLGLATAEYLHSIADKNADATGVEAQRLSIERQGNLVRADAAARAGIDTYSFAEQQRTEQANAFQEYLAPSVIQGSAQANLLNLEETRWMTLADLTGMLTPIKYGDPTSPQGDLHFPNVLLSQSAKESDRLFALEDANNQQRGDWQGRAGLFSVILTLLAVAIYLFGLSLTLQAAIRRWLVGLGVTLVVLGGVSIIVLQFVSPSAPPEAAADAYSEGVYALNTFYTQPGNHGLEEADAKLTQAIQMRPRFARAYLQRSLVRFLIGSPQRNEAFVSITSAGALAAQGDDLQKAYDLGLRDKLLLNDIAANRLLSAITTNRSDYFGAAVAYLNSALQLDPNDPLLYYNKGLALIGQGNTSAAAQTYQDAVARTLYTDVAHKTRRNDANAEESYVGSAVTTLDLLANHRSDLQSQVKSMKELVVNGVARNQAPPGNSLTMSNVMLNVFPGELQWVANIESFDPAKDNVSTQWYYQDPQKLGWSVLSSISGVNAPAFDNNGSGQQNLYYNLVKYLRASGECLQPGKYRAEVYINGHLAGTVTADGTQPMLRAENMPDLAFAFCHPMGWQQDQTNFLRGFSNGFKPSDGSLGGYFFRLQNPEFTGTDPIVEGKAFRDEIFSLPLFKALLPSGAGSPALDCGPTGNGSTTLPWGVPLDANCDRSGGTALELKGANEQWYQYSGGILHVGTEVTADGAVVCVFTFGPDSVWTVSGEPLPDVMFDSIIATQ
jgi:tetratricopeptide (TPR) repeat protein